LERFKSIVLGAIAVRTKLSKREILELAENHPETLRAVVRDDEIMLLLAGYQQFGGPLSEKELEGMLSKIQDCTR
jgi:predicted TIM-barrel enzyme